MYDIILADPAWQYEMTHRRGAAQRHYSTMSVKELGSLPIPANDNAMLFMWACDPLLPEALEVMAAWGFRFRTVAFTWVKTTRVSSSPQQMRLIDSIEDDSNYHIGMGYYTRANPEMVLLGVRGKPIPVQDKGVRQLVIAPVSKHSQKPLEVHKRIDRLYPPEQYRRLEMFARRKAFAWWDVWGNEVESDVVIEAANAATGEVV